jgi:hypothetical protein
MEMAFQMLICKQPERDDQATNTLDYEDLKAFIIDGRALTKGI